MWLVTLLKISIDFVFKESDWDFLALAKLIATDHDLAVFWKIWSTKIKINKKKANLGKLRLCLYADNLCMSNLMGVESCLQHSQGRHYRAWYQCRCGVEINYFNGRSSACGQRPAWKQLQITLKDCNKRTTENMFPYEKSRILIFSLNYWIMRTVTMPFSLDTWHTLNSGLKLLLENCCGQLPNMEWNS